MKKQNKGFTLVELLIVIVIIGILAAIIIPSVSSAIDKANFASDQSDAKNMNTTLLAYCTTNGIDPSELEAPEVRSIVSSQDKNYTFVPKSSNGIFWYNTEKGEIEVTQTGMPTATSKIGNAVYADGTIDSIEEIVDGYLYLNTQGELANWLRSMRNLTSNADYTYRGTELESKDFGSYKTRLNAIYEQYNPLTTLFINTVGSFTDYKAGTPVENIVFGSDIRVVPSMTGTGCVLKEGLVIRIPATVEVVLPGGLGVIHSNNRIEAPKNTVFMDKSLSATLEEANSSIASSYSVPQHQLLSASNALITITAGGVPYTSESTTDTGFKYEYNEWNCCSIFDFSAIESVTDKDFTINTANFLAKYPNVKVLSIQQHIVSLSATVTCKQYYIQAFDNTGMVLNVVITVRADKVLVEK